MILGLSTAPISHYSFNPRFCLLLVGNPKDSINSSFAEKYGISERTVRNYCATGKIEGAFLTGKTWNIPEDTVLPQRKQSTIKVMPLLAVLREQKQMKMKGSIYHRTQIDLTYNSNHIEGSRLTHEQTRHIFETNTLGISEESVNVDDIIETTNHFRCIDLIIDRTEEKLSESFIKELHRILKSGTSDSRKDWFAVGEYKLLPNEVGGHETCLPEDVSIEMKALLKEYNAKNRNRLMIFLIFIIASNGYILFRMGTDVWDDSLCSKNVWQMGISLLL